MFVLFMNGESIAEQCVSGTTRRACLCISLSIKYMWHVRLYSSAALHIVDHLNLLNLCVELFICRHMNDSREFEISPRKCRSKPETHLTYSSIPYMPSRSTGSVRTTAGFAVTSEHGASVRSPNTFRTTWTSLRYTHIETSPTAEMLVQRITVCLCVWRNSNGVGPAARGRPTDAQPGGERSRRVHWQCHPGDAGGQEGGRRAARLAQPQQYESCK